MILYYILVLVIILYLLFKLYIKFTYKFWAYQPVFHSYNLINWINPKGVVHDTPKINKYCNFIDITTKNFFDISEEEIIKIIDLINKTNKTNKTDKTNKTNKTNMEATFLLNKNNFVAFFTGHVNKSYIAIYKKQLYSLNSLNQEATQTIQTIQTTSGFIGVITGKPITITIKNQSLKSYYIDFLTIDTTYTNKDIQGQLIQTYEYYQRHDNKEFKISLFKHNGKLKGIIPFTSYNSYIFNSALIRPKYDCYYKIIEISEVNFYLLINLITLSKTYFKCVVMVAESNLLHLILKNIYKIYGLLDTSSNELKACYFFKQSNITFKVKELYKKEKKNIVLLDLVGSIKNCDNTEFINGFLIVLNKKCYINIENISYNNILIQYLLINSLSALNISYNSFFLYNYISRQIISTNILIIA
jgi:hypothetical protein